MIKCYKKGQLSRCAEIHSRHTITIRRMLQIEGSYKQRLQLQRSVLSGSVGHWWVQI